MKLKELRLTKEELPILHETSFQVPIHPKLLESRVILPEDIAARVFPRTAKEWFEDLKEYRRTANLDVEKGKWYDVAWLKERPRVERDGIHQVIKPGVWRDDYINHENGFARCLSISRNFGGSLYFPGSGSECETILFLTEENEGYIRFTPEKAREFGFREMEIDDDKYVVVHKYWQHNVDNYPGALFLRNWAINYMNEAFKFIAD